MGNEALGINSCPICSSDAHSYKDEAGWAVECIKCIRLEYYDTETQAIAAWNDLQANRAPAVDVALPTDLPAVHVNTDLLTPKDGAIEELLESLKARKELLTNTEFGDEELKELGAYCYDVMNSIDDAKALLAKHGKDGW